MMRNVAVGPAMTRNAPTTTSDVSSDTKTTMTVISDARRNGCTALGRYMHATTTVAHADARMGVADWAMATRIAARRETSRPNSCDVLPCTVSRYVSTKWIVCSAARPSSSDTPICSTAPRRKSKAAKKARDTMHVKPTARPAMTVAVALHVRMCTSMRNAAKPMPDAQAIPERDCSSVSASIQRCDTCMVNTAALVLMLSASRSKRRARNRRRLASPLCSARARTLIFMYTGAKSAASG
mmetsp:Transcript_51990/g.160184  ORF Transcript_51990/g.160184 Transcript_51990/m.160184 type:complete len:240 (+) Transcript_51990:239-958(+)